MNFLITLAACLGRDACRVPRTDVPSSHRYRYTGADLFPIKGNAVKPVTADPNKTEFILLVFAPLKILTPSDRLLSVKKLKS